MKFFVFVIMIILLNSAYASDYDKTEINLNQTSELIVYKSSMEKTKESLDYLFLPLVFLVIFAVVYERWMEKTYKQKR